MNDNAGYTGRLLDDRYRLPRRDLSDGYPPEGVPAYDTASGQDVLVRQVPLPEVVEAEVVGGGPHDARTAAGGATRSPAAPDVRRAMDAAAAASRVPDHPRLDQVFDVFVEGDGLWIVSELLPAQPLSALIGSRPLSAHRAAEIAADLLAALRAVHAQGWVHRNITARTVLVCDDGRAVLTGLATGAAEEALCGYDPLPDPDRTVLQPRGPLPPSPAGFVHDRGAAGALQGPRTGTGPHEAPREGIFGFEGADSGGGPAARAARRGAIAAYRAGTQAASAQVAAEAGQGRGAPPSRPAYGPQGRPYGAPLPPGAGPAALPGPRGEDHRSVPAPWPAGGAEDGREPADTAGAAQDAQVPAQQDRHRGPTTSLAAERARQARMTVVGAVTERWAPEQAGPVYDNWRLAPPVGPAADLWAVGVLLFRAVQGHPPYPEDGVADLVQMVCAEPPAFAEECGSLRPVVESLLRQDPTERPDVEELRGWLRSLIRSAPEPDVGRHVLAGPLSLGPGRPADPRRLPVIRRRGELVRRRRRGRAKSAQAPGRHRHAAAQEPRTPRRRRESRPPRDQHAPRPAGEAPTPPPARTPRPPRGKGAGSPRSLGRLLLGGVLLLLTLAVLYAMWFLPEQGTGGDARQKGSVGEPSEPARESTAGEDRKGAGDTQPQTSEPAVPAKGFRMHEDDTGFRVAVPEGWDRSGPNDRGQVSFRKDGFEMIVVKGRDTAGKYGSDPMAYQSDDEPELEPFRTSDWSSASRLRRIDVGGTAMAEGTYTWQDDGREVYVRNRAMLLDDRYHLVLVTGPADERKAVDRWFEGAADTYRPD